MSRYTTEDTIKALCECEGLLIKAQEIAGASPVTNEHLVRLIRPAIEEARGQYALLRQIADQGAPR